MIVQGDAGINVIKQTAGNLSIIQGNLSETIISELSPAYYSLLKNRQVFFVSGAGTGSGTFTGGAGGSPLIGLNNPPHSGFDIVVLQTRIGIRTNGSGGGAGANFAWWGSQSPVSTGTATVPTNAYSLQQGGSCAVAFVDVNMTGSAATNLLCPILSLGASATATKTSFQSNYNMQGTIIAAPGNLICFGCSGSLGSNSFDTTVIWAEIPV